MRPKKLQKTCKNIYAEQLNDELYQKIIENRSYFDFLQQYAFEGFLIVDINRIEDSFINTKLFSSLGYKQNSEDKEDTILSYKDLIYNEDHHLMEKITPSFSESNKNSFVVRFVHQRNYILWFECNITSFVNKNNQERIVIAVKDITKFKKPNLHFSDRIKRYEHIVDGTGLGIWEWNVQTGETIFNSNWAKILGYNIEELRPTSVRTWEQFAHPIDAKNCLKILNKHLIGRIEFYATETRMQHKNGHWIWVVDKGKIVSWTEDGKPEWMTGYTEEITLKKKEADRSKQFILNAPTAIAMFDSQMRYIVTSKKWKKDFQVEELDLFEKCQYDVFPNSKVYWKSIYEKVLKGEYLYKDEDEFIDRFGQKRYLKWSMNPWFSDDQEIGGIIVHSTDITKLKEIEKLSETRRQFLETVLDSLEVGIVSCNENGHVTLFNKTTREWHGLTEANISPEEYSNYYGLFETDGFTPLKTEDIPLLQILETGKAGKKDILIKGKSGINRIVSISGSQIKNNFGKIMGAVAAMYDITHIRMAEEKLRLSEETLRGNFENAAIGMAICDLKTKPIRVNKSLCDIVGYTEKELLKTTLFDLVAQNDYDVLEKLVKETIEINRDHFHIEVQFKTKVNKYIHVVIFASLVKNSFGQPLYLTTQFKNITPRKLAEHKLNKTLAYQNALLAASTKVSFIATDNLGIIFDFNQGAENLLGYSAKEIISEKNILQFLEDKQLARKKGNIFSLYKKNVDNFDILTFEADNFEHVTEEWHYINKNSSKIPVLLTVTPIILDAKKVGYLHAAIEIKDIKDARNEILSLLDVTKEQNQRLLNFAHIVSHNLRSHSGNFRSLLDLLNMENPALMENEIIQLLGTASNNLRETIEHLNEVVLLNTKVHDNLTLLNLEEFIENALENTSALAIEGEVKIYCDIDKLSMVLAVPAYLDSILLNFITNGIKYRAKNRKSFIKLKSIFDTETNKVVLTIEDNGLGIDLKQHRHKLFGMYKTFHHNKDSRGIGLFITKNQIEAIGGKIEVESEVNKGTKFKIYFKHEKN